MRSFDPFDWYWALPKNAGFYASARGVIVQADDTSLHAWMAAGAGSLPGDLQAAGWQPTPCPRDEKGAQTLAALSAVLAPYGLTLPA